MFPVPRDSRILESEHHHGAASVCYPFYYKVFKDVHVLEKDSTSSAAGQIGKRSPGFYLLSAKWLFFWPNTIMITRGCRGCTFDAASAGGRKN